MSSRESAACERAVAAVLAGMTTPHARDVYGVALSTITRALRRRGVAPMSPRPLDVVSRAIWVPRSTPPDALARVQALATHLGAALRRGARVRVVGLPLVPVAWVDAALMGAVARGYLFLPRQYPPISRGDWRQYLQEHTDLKGVSGAMWLILRTERDRKTAPRYSNGQLMPAWNYQEPCWLFSRDVGRWLEADGYCVAFAEDLPGVPVDTALGVAP